MIPQYNAKNFTDLDRRRYQIKTIADAIAFFDYIRPRVEQCQEVLKKANYQINMSLARETNLKKRLEDKEIVAPAATPIEQNSMVESIEDQEASQEKEQLLQELMEEVAEEQLADQLSNTPDTVIKEVLDKYAVTLMQKGPRRGQLVFYMNNKMAAEKNIPADVVAALKVKIQPKVDKWTQGARRTV